MNLKTQLLLIIVTGGSMIHLWDVWSYNCSGWRNKVSTCLLSAFMALSFKLIISVFIWQAKIVPDNEQNYKYCVYDSDRATGYGVVAFLFLMVSQIVIMVVSRCFCCGKPLKPGGSRACAIVLFIICWYISLT